MSTSNPLVALDQYRAMRRRTVSAAFSTMQRARSPEGNQRSLPRARIAIPITLHLDEWETDTETTDLSRDGCAFVSNHAPTQNQFRLAVELAPRRMAEGYARVVAVVPRGNQFYVCVTFSQLDEGARAAIEERVLGALLAG